MSQTIDESIKINGEIQKIFEKFEQKNKETRGKFSVLDELIKSSTSTQDLFEKIEQKIKELEEQSQMLDEEFEKQTIKCEAAGINMDYIKSKYDSINKKIWLFGSIW